MKGDFQMKTHRFDKVCVIGLGEVGLPTAKYVSKLGLDVFGYDISIEAVRKAKKEGIKATIKWDEIPPVDVYIICVSTGLKENTPDFTSIFDVSKKIKEKIDLSNQQTKPLVSIESTVVPGLSRRIFEDIFKQSCLLVHVPHRYWKEDPIKYGVKQLRVIGGIDKESLKVGVDFYQNFLGIPLYVVTPIEVAEMSKIAENAYRYVQIAFAEELRMICEELGLNFEDVRRACNTKWNIEILEARDGIGGHCLPKDIRYLITLSKHNVLLKSAITVDNQYREWLKGRTNKK